MIRLRGRLVSLIWPRSVRVPESSRKSQDSSKSVDGRAREDLGFYRDRLDFVWNTFGPDRCFYGSDWPNSEQWASYAQVFHLADSFISSRDPGTIEKFYRSNAEAVYRLNRH